MSGYIWPFLFCFVPKTVYGTKFFELFAKLFRIFRPRGNFFDGPIFFQNLADSAAIRLVQKSSKSEPSSPFFGRLKFRGKFVPCELLQNFLCGYKIEMAICCFDRRNEAFEFDLNCQAHQRAWQFESNSNAIV